MPRPQTRFHHRDGSTKQRERPCTPFGRGGFGALHDRHRNRLALSPMRLVLLAVLCACAPHAPTSRAPDIASDERDPFGSEFRERVQDLAAGRTVLYAYSSSWSAERRRPHYIFAVEEDGTVWFEGNDLVSKPGRHSWTLSAARMAKLKALVESSRVLDARVGWVPFAMDATPHCLMIRSGERELSGCFSADRTECSVCDFAGRLRFEANVAQWSGDHRYDCSRWCGTRLER